MHPHLHQKFFITFGDVIILTQWPLGELVTVSESTDDRCELVRTLDDGDARLIEDTDDIKHECPDPYDSRHTLLHPMLP